MMLSKFISYDQVKHFVTVSHKIENLRCNYDEVRQRQAHHTTPYFSTLI
jgi:hypothetical protein